jgi:hypothetical protein
MLFESESLWDPDFRPYCRRGKAPLHQSFYIDYLAAWKKLVLFFLLEQNCRITLLDVKFKNKEETWWVHGSSWKLSERRLATSLIFWVTMSKFLNVRLGKGITIYYRAEFQLRPQMKKSSWHWLLSMGILLYHQFFNAWTQTQCFKQWHQFSLSIILLIISCFLN